MGAKTSIGYNTASLKGFGIINCGPSIPMIFLVYFTDSERPHHWYPDRYGKMVFSPSVIGKIHSFLFGDAVAWDLEFFPVRNRERVQKTFVSVRTR